MDAETRRRAQTILNQVGNGFNARKRGLMLNYQLGKKKKMLTDIKGVDDQTEDEGELPPSPVANVKDELAADEDLVDVEITDDAENKSSPPPKRAYDKPIEPLQCGGAECEKVFRSVASRTRHRTKYHPELFFIDTEEDLYVFK